MIAKFNTGKSKGHQALNLPLPCTKAYSGQKFKAKIGLLI